MKKTMIALLALGMSIAASVTVWAGPFENFYDYENQDGSYTYYFDQGQGVFVTMDENWYRHTLVITNDHGASFFHRESYDAFAEEGWKDGGWLFTLCASKDTNFRDLPGFEYIGFDDEANLYYYADLPTDYRAYAENKDIRDEYDALGSQVSDVIAGITIGSKQDKAGSLSGGWEITGSSSLAGEPFEAFKQAVKDTDDVMYEPIALLAKQVVAGMNYCILCRETAFDQAGTMSYCLLYIWKAPGKDAVILETQPIEFGLSDQAD